MWCTVLPGGVFGAPADGDNEKPAAVAASKTGSGSGGTATSAIPGAVQVSKAKPTFGTHLKVAEAYVPLKMRKDGTEVAHSLDEVSVTITGRDGAEATYSDDEWSIDTSDMTSEGGVTAFQILVEQGLFRYVEGIGFIPTKEYWKVRGKTDASSGGGGAAGSGGKGGSSSLLGAGGSGIDVKSKKQTDMVDPGKPQSVAEDPSQSGTFGGLMGADFAYDEECMAKRDKWYDECCERCRARDKNGEFETLEDFGKCIEKCSKDSLSYFGTCETAPRTREDQWR
jgi:hypothetical protein